MILLHIILALAFSLPHSSVAAASKKNSHPSPPSQEAEFVNNQLLIKFKESLSGSALESAKSKILEKYNFKFMQNVSREHLILVATPDNQLNDWIEKLKSEPDVQYAEGNLKLRIFSPPKQVQ